MTERRFAVSLPPIVAGLLLTGSLVAGCTDVQSRHSGADEGAEERGFFLSDEPARPTDQGRSEEREEERDPGGY